MPQAADVGLGGVAWVNIEERKKKPPCMEEGRVLDPFSNPFGCTGLWVATRSTGQPDERMVKCTRRIKMLTKSSLVGYPFISRFSRSRSFDTSLTFASG